MAGFHPVTSFFALIGGFYGLEGPTNFLTQEIAFSFKDFISQRSAQVSIDHAFFM